MIKFEGIIQHEVVCMDESLRFCDFYFLMSIVYYFRSSNSFYRSLLHVSRDS